MVFDSAGFNMLCATYRTAEPINASSPHPSCARAARKP